jgi:Xaa-Pro aminopeptidase
MGNTTPLEPGMVISVEPIYQTPFGMIDLEDQYVITADGAECLHEPAPEELPVVT